MQFKTINALTDIEDLMQRASSNDGEGLSFELKGSQGETKFNKDHKKLLSKEICAFANTYGGILCFHYGGDTTIEKFPDGILSGNFNSIEGWLRDSLEPKLLGMEIKIVDDVYLINIPESKTKPHRTAITSEYYYRHSTISQKMPEIMISSMYRSQDYLNYTSSVSLSRLGSEQLAINICIQNHSNLSGTKPKVKVQLFIGRTSKDIKSKDIRFCSAPYFEDFIKDSFSVSPLFASLKIPLNGAGVTETNSEFSERILYPQDSIYITNFSKPDNDIKDVKYILVRMDCMFKESIRQTEYKIFELGKDGKSEIYMSAKEKDEAMILITFKQLINQQENEV